jgi:hypothetical protein
VYRNITITFLNNEGEEDEMGVDVARMGEKSNAYRLLVRKPEGRRSLGRPRRRWVDNIRMGLVEVGWGNVDWIVGVSSVQRTRDLSSSAQLHGGTKVG